MFSPQDLTNPDFLFDVIISHQRRLEALENNSCNVRGCKSDGMPIKLMINNEKVTRFLCKDCLEQIQRTATFSMGCRVSTDSIEANR